MEALILILVFGGLIAGLILLFRYVKKAGLKKVEWYKSWALKLNLTHSDKKHMLTRLNSLSGYLDGHQVFIYEKIVGSGKNQHLYTYIAFQPSPISFEFSISREGLFSKTAKAFGAKDIEFGDEEFDKLFLLKSPDEAQFRNMLDYNAQNELRSIGKKLSGSITNKDSNLIYHFLGGLTKEEKVKDLEAILNFMRLLIRNSNKR